MQREISETLKSIDNFSFSRVIAMDRNVLAVRSTTGAFCTLIMFMLVGAFSLLKLNNLVYQRDIYLTNMPEDNYFDDSSQFGLEDGLAIAVAFVDYWAENLSDEEISKYIDIQIGTTAWGIDENEVSFWKRTPIKTHACTPEDLNSLEEPSETSVFYPLKQQRRSEVRNYMKQFKCLDSPEELSIHGNYNSADASLFMLAITKCTGRLDCKSDEEITEFLKGKFVGLYYNRKNFDARGFRDDAFVSQSDLLWVPISSQNSEQALFNIKQSEVHSQHQLINLDEVTDVEAKMFTIQAQDRYPMETGSRHFLLTVGVDYELGNYERIYYTFLDMLSDIGGIQAIIVGFLAGLLSAIKHDYFDDYLVSSLYKLAPSSATAQDGEKFELDKYCNILGCLRDTLMSASCRSAVRSRQGRKECAMIEARQKLMQELNRVDIVRQLRLIQFAICDLLPERRIEELKSKSEYFAMHSLTDNLDSFNSSNQTERGQFELKQN